MATSSETIRYIADQAGLGHRLSSKKMFGEFALYVDDKVVALVCDDQLFLKATDLAKRILGGVKMAPPYPGAKDHLLITDELEDPDRLKELLIATAAALPEPKPKKSVNPAKSSKKPAARVRKPSNRT